jgi:hypothetical protein
VPDWALWTIGFAGAAVGLLSVGALAVGGLFYRALWMVTQEMVQSQREIDDMAKTVMEQQVELERQRQLAEDARRALLDHNLALAKQRLEQIIEGT